MSVHDKAPHAPPNADECTIARAVHQDVRKKIYKTCMNVRGSVAIFIYVKIDTSVFIEDFKDKYVRNIAIDR